MTSGGNKTVTFVLTRLFWRVRPSGRDSQAAAGPAICTAGSSRAPPAPQAENRRCTVGQRAQAAAVAVERDDDDEGGDDDEPAEEGDAAEPGPEFRPVEDAARMVALGCCSSVEEEVDADAEAADAGGADADLSGAGFLQSGPAPSSRDRRFSASVSV